MQSKSFHRGFVLPSLACLALPYFLRDLIKVTIFGKCVLNIKFLVLFSLQLLSETFLILRRTEQKIFINLIWLLCKLPKRYSCNILIKPDFPLHVFEKVLNTKFHEYPSSGS